MGEKTRETRTIAVIFIVAIVAAGAYLLFGHGDYGDRISRSQLREYSYCASVNSEVFHRPQCRWPQKIHESNLLGFKTREEVLKSGRRPCKTCRP